MIADGGLAHVLVVEDDELDAERFVRCLEKRGVTVTIANRAYEAVSYLKDESWAAGGLMLVLLDWKLTGNPRTVLRTMRQSPRLELTPVVVLSRSRADVDVRAALKAGASVFVSKPHDHYEFERRLDTICDLWLTMAEIPTQATEAAR
jgi:CheY-like chemotaxis protein